MEAKKRKRWSVHNGATTALPRVCFGLCNFVKLFVCVAAIIDLQKRRCGKIDGNSWIICALLRRLYRRVIHIERYELRFLERLITEKYNIKQQTVSFSRMEKPDSEAKLFDYALPRAIINDIARRCYKLKCYFLIIILRKVKFSKILR